MPVSWHSAGTISAAADDHGLNNQWHAEEGQSSPFGQLNIIPCHWTTPNVVFSVNPAIISPIRSLRKAQMSSR
jgi:hypothetical protein